MQWTLHHVATSAKHASSRLCKSRKQGCLVTCSALSSICSRWAWGSSSMRPIWGDTLEEGPSERPPTVDPGVANPLTSEYSPSVLSISLAESVALPLNPLSLQLHPQSPPP